MTFSPCWSTKIMAMPVAPGTVLSRPRSTPSARSSRSASVAKLSVPTAQNILTSAPARRAASAWLAPLPPAAIENWSPGTVSPGPGMRLTVPMRSRLVEPSTVIIEDSAISPRP